MRFLAGPEHGHGGLEERVRGSLLADCEVGAKVGILRFENEAEELLHYLRDAGHNRTDERLAEAIDVVRRNREPDGRWPLQIDHGGESWIQMEAAGEPSRWITLAALRVLDAFG